MKKKKLWVLVLLVILVSGAAWAFWPRTDPQLAKVQQMQQQLFNESTPPDERRKAFQEFREEMEKLTPDQRDKMMRDNPPPFMRQMRQNVRDFFDLPPSERTKALDRQIDEFEKRRKQMEQRMGQGQGGPGGGPRGGFGGGGGGDPARQNDFRKRMLDNTTPQDRAMMSEYFREMQKRRQQRGLPGFPGQ